MQVAAEGIVRSRRGGDSISGRSDIIPASHPGRALSIERRFYLATLESEALGCTALGSVDVAEGMALSAGKTNPSRTGRIAYPLRIA